MVHGEITFPNKDIDDFVVLRSDGTPIYNLAVVSDDIAMGITLVMRGDDHISNTPKQIMLYQALGAPLPFESADMMVENAIGIMSVPMGIATNFVINGREYLIPMAIEEPSVVAAASKAAKIAKAKGGFAAQADDSLMIGQVQVVGAGRSAMQKITKSKKQLLATANSKSRSVVAVDLKVRQLRDSSPNRTGSMIIVELVIDTKDAMGANAVNTMCEAIGPQVAEITGGEVVLKILSNYATKRIVRCKAVFDKNELGGSEIVRRILYAYALAHSDVYRAVTHNKGVMNGIDAVALATGQDFRAIEAGAHGYPLDSLAGVPPGVFNLVNAVLLRPFPFQSPDRIGLIWAVQPTGERTWLAFPELEELQAVAPGLSGVAGLTDLRMAASVAATGEEVQALAPEREQAHGGV